MILKELFIKTYQIVKFNLILVQPLLIFLFFSGILLTTLSRINQINPAAVIFFVLTLEIFCAFLAGWFNMFHKGIELYEKPAKDDTEKAMSSLELFKEFFPGIGQHFSRFNLGFILYILMFLLMLNIAGYIGNHAIGIPQSMNPNELISMFANENHAKEVLSKISDADKLRIAKWNLLTLLSTGIFGFLTIYFIPAMICADNTPLKALLKGVKTSFKKPIMTVLILLSFWISIFIVSIINAVSAENFILQLVGLMLFVFCIIYFNMMIFVYFEKYCENSCHSWTDSFR